MPRGFSGAPARSYLAHAEAAQAAAHAVIDTAPAVPGLPPVKRHQLPYASSSVGFTPGGATGIRTSRKIVFDAQAQDSLKRQINGFGVNSVRALKARLDEIDAIATTDLQLPATSTQVQLVSRLLRETLGTFAQIMQGFEQTLSTASRILTAGGGNGSDAGIEWNQGTAEGIRVETEAVMKRQVSALRDQAGLMRQQSRVRGDQAERHRQNSSDPSWRPQGIPVGQPVPPARRAAETASWTRLRDEALALTG
ncbi:MAG: hypothetical protein FWD83_06410, partial [Promicromonosporaceae bacterium]|nr:hypothetical protein [Promicromonosporaceae bacterium]